MEVEGYNVVEEMTEELKEIRGVMKNAANSIEELVGDLAHGKKYVLVDKETLKNVLEALESIDALSGENNYMLVSESEDN